MWIRIKYQKTSGSRNQIPADSLYQAVFSINLFPMKKLLTFPALLVLSLVFTQCTKDSGDIAPVTDGGSEEYTDGFGFKGGGGGGLISSGDSTQQIEVEPGQITAAEWNDLANWDFWNNLGQLTLFDSIQDNWQFYPLKRYAFRVTDNNQIPVIDCEVELRDGEGEVIWKTRTDNTGNAELWTDLNGGNTTVETAVVKYAGQEIVLVDPMPYSQGTNLVSVSYREENPDAADIAFVVDATGSMGDEINYLKSELSDVIRRVKDAHAGTSFRYGSVFYRDEGDEYLTRVSGFSTDAGKVLGFIDDQTANGGGDYEEAVHTALSIAVSQLQWSGRAKARLLFLVLDAPPHHTEPIINDLHDIIHDAATKGIHIIPVAASGVNKDSEFLFRFFAIATSGTYVFITNDSGIGNDHIIATVGEYEVELLNDLLVRLVNKYTE
jgi:hypothetical protein